MPGFLWTGNQTIDGKNVELYRMYVFTDNQCLNTVYTSAVIGSDAYAPRPFGPLSLPGSGPAMAAARSSYLADGTEPPSFSYDGGTVKTTESTADATPTTSIPGAPGDATATPASSSSTSSPSSSGGSGLTLTGRTGAPTDLWDTNWPSSGYYWTVVGVAAESPGSMSTNVGAAGAKAADIALPLQDTTGFNPGDIILIGSGPTQESGTITAVNGNVVTLALGLKFGHGFGEPVVRSGGGFEYQDLELPQDVCAAGRVMRFGKESEPSLVSSGQLFATGLSSNGRLTSAVQKSAFYGQPLVSWTPALGAEAYEVQWSKTQYPFKPEVCRFWDPRVDDLCDLGRATGQDRDVVVPRARLRLLVAHRRPADVVVGPGQARGRRAEIQARDRRRQSRQAEEAQVALSGAAGVAAEARGVPAAAVLRAAPPARRV